MEVALKAARVRYYETPQANWGRGQPGFWVNTEEQVASARRAIADAQQQWKARNESQRELHETSRLRNPKLWTLAAVIFIILAQWFFLFPGAR